MEYKNKYGILLVVISMTFMSCLVSNIVNVALPVMSRKLSVPMVSIEWVVASYIISICSTILIFGRLGDIIGKMKVFKFGMVVFTITSFMCGISTSFTELIIFRIIQGIGASAYMANNQGIITQVFPRNERGKALGILASSVALGTLIGSPAGGFITYYLSWNYIFFVNVPIGVIAFIAALKVLPHSKIQNKEINSELDVKGSTFIFLSMVLLFGSLIQGQKIGYNNPIIITIFIVSILFIAVFIVLENKIEKPLIQMKIFKNNVFSLSLFCAFISFVCLNASIIIIPFYLQDAMKLNSSITGLIMMVQPLVIAVISPLSGNLSDKIGSKLLSFLGLLLMSISFIFLSFLNQYSSITKIIIYIVVLALGQSLFQPSNNSLIMSTVPKNELGIAGSVNSLVRNLGQIIGIILSTSLLYSFMSIKIGYRITDYVTGRDDIFVYGMRYVYIVLTIVCAFGALLTAFRMCNKKSPKIGQSAADVHGKNF
ncbi:DHA2 family efflux MFS transporter permease subunit [Clostridium autoethanogenum]|uniref:DHA2 family efflux MFS transporter permease subunit n=1 Tax=Clostridium autoethanogenum TaxID=84023 RepID=A0A3M0T0K9_9CLOT|nr:MFS transporter [Clostridium autoethanogenum]RMD04179.1 DHA2 family efflux MFS transporter permease subunit [Clostridium autoethanogenum]